MNVGRLTETYAAWIMRWRWVIIVISLLVVFGLASGLERVKFSGDYRDFFKPDDPQLAQFELLQNAYSNDSNALVVFEPKDGDVFSSRTLTAMETLTAAAWKLPYVRRVDSLTNYQHASATGDDLTVRSLVRNPETLGPDELQHIRKVALSEPLLVKRLASPRGHVAAVNISFTLPKKSEQEIPQATARLKEELDRIRQAYPEIRLYLSGVMLLDNAFDEHAQKDLETLTPLMYVLILVVVLIALRSISGMMITLVVLTSAILAAIGAAGLLGIKLTAASVTVPTILMTIAVANCMHLLIYIAKKMGAGMERVEAVRQSLVLNLPLILVACVTDILGFFSMMFSDVPPIADFGFLLGIGALAILLLSITLLPAMAAVLPLKGRARLHQQGEWLGRAVLALTRHRKTVYTVAVLVNVVAAYYVAQNRFEDNFVEYFDHSVPFRKDTAFIADNLTGVQQLFYSIPAGKGESVDSPVYLQGLERLTRWLRAQPEVDSVSSLTDIVKKVNRTMNGDDPAHYRVPQRADEASQLLLLFEMALPPGLELNDQIRIDRSASRMTVVLKDMTSARMIDFDNRVQAWMRDNLPPHMAAPGTGPSLMFARIGERNVAGTMEGYLLQILLISFVICVVLRSVRMGVVSLVPNVMPSLLAFGLWGYFVGQIGLSVAVVAVLTYGIIVDDTIHSIFKYDDARRRLSMQPQDAIVHVYSISGLAIAGTTAILVLGFLVLCFSNFDLNSDLGVMSALTIGIAAVVDLALLPPLLIGYAHGKNTSAGNHPGRLEVINKEGVS